MDSVLILDIVYRISCALLGFHLAKKRTRSKGAWTLLGALFGLVAILVLALLKPRPPKRRILFERHVSLTRDGLGATFQRILEPDGQTRWQWHDDEGLQSNFSTMVAAQWAITQIEKELGLPLTFPHADSSTGARKNPVASDEEIRDRLIRRLEANPDDVRARVSLLSRDARPIDAADLIVGYVYDVSFDLGIFRRSFVGVQWEGYPEFADDPGDHDEWFEFETPTSSCRTRRSDWGVSELPVTQDVALSLFERLRAAG